MDHSLPSCSPHSDFGRSPPCANSGGKFHIDHAGRHVEGAIDEVDGVGTFVELELIADEANLEAAKQVIRELAAELDLGPTERRSYLEMLLEKRNQRPMN